MRLEARRQEQDAVQQEAMRQYEARWKLMREERSATQGKKRLEGTGFSSLKEVDSNWSRFGFVPKPGATVSGAAGPSQLPDQIVEI